VVHDHGVILKSEVAHEAERALRKRDHRWDVVAIELLRCPQDCPIASKRDDVSDLPLAAFTQWVSIRRDLFGNAMLLDQCLVGVKAVEERLLHDEIN